MKKPLSHTKVTVKLRKSQYKEEWYLIVEAYPVVSAGNKVERIVESAAHQAISPSETSTASSCAVLLLTKNHVSMLTT